MTQSPYGPKLSDEEYERAVVELHGRQPDMPSRAEDREIRRQELFLMIDHRLGTEFPTETREALWRVHQDVERRRLRLVFGSLLRRFSVRGRAQRANTLAARLVDEYARVLGREDAERFFGLEPGEPPSLPVDSE